MSMRTGHFFLLAAAALAASSACSEDERPPASLGSSGSASSAGKGGRAGSSGQTEGGSDASPEGGAGRAGAAGGAPSADGGQGIDYETAGAPTFIPGVCDVEMMPGEETALEVDPAVEGATLLSLTPDERSVAFVTGEDEDTVLHVGDRATRDAPFQSQEVTLPPGYEATSGVALSQDALELVLVLEDHSGFGKLTRAKRGDAFSADADVTAFTRINAQKPMSGRELGWPVLSADGETLYFLSYFQQGLVVQSTKGTDGRFDLGREIDEYTLGGGVGAYKRINAVSGDQRAIFFFDEATKRAMALFRSRPDAPFYEPIDLGARRGAAPNADCTRLYSSVDGELVAQDVE
jgi:hypothetical protein